MLQAEGLREFAAESDGLTRLGPGKMAADFSSRLDEASREIASRAVPLEEEETAQQQLAQCRRDVEAFGRSEFPLRELLRRQPGLFDRGSTARSALGESQERCGVNRRVASGESGLSGGKAPAARLRAGAVAARGPRRPRKRRRLMALRFSILD